MNYLKAFAALAAFCLSSSAFALQCGSVPLLSGDLSYCAPDAIPSKSSAADVIYYLHGMNGSAQDIRNFEQLQKTLQQFTGDQPIVFIGLSTGPQGVFTSNAHDIVATGMTEIEHKFFGNAKITRHLTGASMGGYNSARLSADSPEAFHDVSLLCPALMAIDPRDPTAVEAYKQRHAKELDLNFFNAVMGLYAQTFASEEAWQQNDSFTFLAQGRYDKLPFFVSIGRQDSLGFFEGASLFVDQAKARGISVQFAPVDGPHCVFDPAALAKFLIGQL